MSDKNVRYSQISMLLAAAHDCCPDELSRVIGVKPLEDMVSALFAMDSKTFQSYRKSVYPAWSDEEHGAYLMVPRAHLEGCFS